MDKSLPLDFYTENKLRFLPAFVKAPLTYYERVSTQTRSNECRSMTTPNNCTQKFQKILPGFHNQKQVSVSPPFFFESPRPQKERASTKTRSIYCRSMTAPDDSTQKFQ